MIKLRRHRSPDAIPARYRGEKRIDNNRKLMALLLDDQPPNSSFWRDSKPQLKVEANSKCAYCEAHTATVVYGDVEHYRPKSVYWWLAYCYDNYLFACSICNQQYKSAWFPRHGDPWPEPPLSLEGPDEQDRALADALSPDPLEPGDEWERFQRRSQAEEAGLINPYETDPEPLLAWRADAVCKEVWLSPRGDDPVSARSVDAAEKYYGLNREELRRLRWRVYEQLDTFRQVLEAPLPDALKATVKGQVRKMTDDAAPFAGMARFFMREVWALPGLCPEASGAA